MKGILSKMRAWRWKCFALATVIVCYASSVLVFYRTRHTVLKPMADDATYLRSSGYQDDWLDEAYRRGPTVSLRQEFVGSSPLYPACNTSLPPGIPHWGNLPYMDPFPYVKESKNPCWRDSRKKRLQCLPYFFVGGVSKAGTTDLFARILQHPDVVNTAKETEWFTNHRYRGPVNFTKYTEVYSKLATSVQSDLKRLNTSRKISGDGTTDVFHSHRLFWGHLSGNENCSEPRVLEANHIIHLIPNARFIFLFRNPVDRLHSQFLFDATWKKTPCYQLTAEKFHEFATNAVERLTSCMQRWSLRHCTYDKTLFKKMDPLRLQESLYPVILEDWLRIVPRHQMLFLRFEDYRKNIAKSLQEVFNFLQLEPVNSTVLQRISNSTSGQNQGKYYDVFGPMLPKTRQLVHNFFQPFMRRLATMLGDDRFSWSDQH